MGIFYISTLLVENMDKDKVNTFILSNIENFSPEDVPMIRAKMENAEDSKWSLLAMQDFKNPNTALMLSIFGGPIGIDRLYIGDHLLGIFKTITCGGIFIWAFVDMFLIKKATRKNNLSMLMYALNT